MTYKTGTVSYRGLSSDWKRAASVGKAILSGRTCGRINGRWKHWVL